MCDLPENLQIIKREHSPPCTPEDKSPNNIKAKLNLHVKRRLQDFNQTSEEKVTASHSQLQDHNAQHIIDIKQEVQKTEAVVRQKRPYHKRTDKNKPAVQTLEIPLTTAAGLITTTPQRKYKHKIKQIVNTIENQELSTANSSEEQSTAAHNAAITTGAISAGDEDEGGHDNELKTSRDKEKCPDVLAMVLSAKKRTLMQDPEVQKFLKDVMEVMKS